MTETIPSEQRGEAARELALAAALRRFSAQSYEHVGLRHIAADAGLDVARVHRMFGSKEALFGACVERAFAKLDWNAQDPAALAQTITHQLLKPASDDCDPLQLLARSAADPHAAPMLAARTRDALLAPAGRLARAPSDAAAQQNAALLAALAIGISTVRNVLHAPALAPSDDDALAERIEDLLHACLAPDQAQAAPAGKATALASCA
ncbi:TetR/AcrR family transcriptional regulator [Xanthobacteraceae bacterium A53D]